jgi:hypothetical protein
MHKDKVGILYLSPEFYQPSVAAVARVVAATAEAVLRSAATTNAVLLALEGI